MAGRKPDYRLVIVEENKGRKVSFKLGSGWKNENKETGEVSVGIEVNAGVPLVLQPHTKLVLFENKEQEEENDTEFQS